VGSVNYGQSLQGLHNTKSLRTPALQDCYACEFACVQLLNTLLLLCYAQVILNTLHFLNCAGRISAFGELFAAHRCFHKFLECWRQSDS